MNNTLHCSITIWTPKCSTIMFDALNDNSKIIHMCIKCFEHCDKNDEINSSLNFTSKYNLMFKCEGTTFHCITPYSLIISNKGGVLWWKI